MKGGRGCSVPQPLAFLHAEARGGGEGGDGGCCVAGKGVTPEAMLPGAPNLSAEPGGFVPRGAEREAGCLRGVRLAALPLLLGSLPGRSPQLRRLRGSREARSFPRRARGGPLGGSLHLRSRRRVAAPPGLALKAQVEAAPKPRAARARPVTRGGEILLAAWVLGQGSGPSARADGHLTVLLPRLGDLPGGGSLPRRGLPPAL